MNASWRRLGERLSLLVLFALMAAGLGYATLNRYDSTTLAAMPDTKYYVERVVGQGTGPWTQWDGRVLVPALARPIYAVIAGHTRTWNAAFVGLLVVNASFCGLTCLLMVMLSDQMAGSRAIGLLGACVYLLNFDIANGQVAGLVDSAETALILASVYCMRNARWAALPVVGVVGALAKETFVPLSLTLAGVWLLSQPQKSTRRQWLVYVALVAVELLTLGLIPYALGREGAHTSALTESFRAPGSVVRQVIDCLTAHEFWFTFGWLLPLGALRIRTLDRAWTLSTAAAFVMALALGALSDARGNASRGMFDVAGPMLSLSAATYLLQSPRQSFSNPVGSAGNARGLAS